MGRRWKWFLRPRKVVLDLTGQAPPDGDVPGRFRRLAVENVVPELRVTSRCDDALVYERPEERMAAALVPNQRAGPARQAEPGEVPRTGRSGGLCRRDGAHLPPDSLGLLDRSALPAKPPAVSVFDLSPTQIRNRLILRARWAARAAGVRPPLRPCVCGRGQVGAAARVPVTPVVSVVPGDVVRLAEVDCRYAAGPLRLRIVRVRLDLSQWYDGQWVWLEGVEIGPDGQDGALPKPVLVRVAALRPEEHR